MEYNLYGLKGKRGHKLYLRTFTYETTCVAHLGQLDLSKQDFSLYNRFLSIPFAVPDIPFPKNIVSIPSGPFNCNYCLGDFYVIHSRNPGAIGLFLPRYELQSGRTQENRMVSVDSRKVGEAIILPNDRLENRLYLI
ncbi:MAG: hypothetical protein ACQESG_08340 [Nanobdellota archaeon]